MDLINKCLDEHFGLKQQSKKETNIKKEIEKVLESYGALYEDADNDYDKNLDEVRNENLINDLYKLWKQKLQLKLKRETDILVY